MKGVHLGLLLNWKQLTVWQFNHPNYPQCLIDLDIVAVIQEWNKGILSENNQKSLEDLFSLFRKESFTGLHYLEKRIALDEIEWQEQASVLENGNGNEAILVESLQSLVKELEGNARRLLEGHLTRYDEYQHKIRVIQDDSTESAIQ